MKILTCRDMEVDCDFAAKGATADEVIKMAADHVATAHPDVMSSMSSEESKVKMMSMMKDEM